jgi:hypothetical protein
MRLNKRQLGILAKTTETSAKVSSLLLWWDMKESRKQYHNRHAFGQYFAALERAEALVDDGATWANALNTSFCGRLLAHLNKHLALGISDADLNQ